jgi:hypothetical protein
MKKSLTGKILHTIKRITAAALWLILNTLLILAVFLIFNILHFQSGDRFCIGIGSFEDRPSIIDAFYPLQRSLNTVAPVEEDNQYNIYFTLEFADRESAEAYTHKLKSILKNSAIDYPDMWIKPAPISTVEIEKIIDDDEQDRLQKADHPNEYIYRFKTTKYPYITITEKTASVKYPLRKPASIKAGFQMLQAVPEYGSIPAGSPVVLFFNSRIFVRSIPDNIWLKINNRVVEGTIRVFLYAPGKSAVSIAPINPNHIGRAQVYITGRLADLYGGRLNAPASVQFTYHRPNSYILNNENFRDKNKLLTVAGDAAIVAGNPQVIPAKTGGNYLAMSNSDSVVSSSPSIAGKSSYFAFRRGALNRLTVDYNFISSEFNELAADHYSDISMIIVSGKEYQKTYILSSVLYTGIKNEPVRYRSFFNLPDRGDSHTGMTGWKRFSAANQFVEGPVVVTFILTDLIHTGYTSILLLDGIYF